MFINDLPDVIWRVNVKSLNQMNNFLLTKYVEPNIVDNVEPKLRTLYDDNEFIGDRSVHEMNDLHF